jgi:DNA primase
MGRYTEDSVDRVRDAVDMLDLVGSRTELRKSGGTTYMAICPFHDERTPSMSVDVVKKLYHCFGCDAGGDAISFVRELEGVDFVGAIELLADRYGVQLEVAEEDPREAERRARRERLLALLDRTAAYYERVLWESAEAEAARSYLLGRGLSEESLRAFRVGYAPSAWDRVLMASRRNGFSNQELYDAGLATRGREGRLYDRFRARITFPLSDARGRVIGFGARAMGEGRGPKYLNTAESELFHKGKIVYAAHLARAAAAREGRVIVVEGYTDVIALWQAGFANTVAIMGTSMTEHQVEALRRLAPVALLALDADNAGQEAMVRAARVAAGKKLELRVVPLPAGSDPADLLAKPSTSDGAPSAAGADAMRDLLGRSMPFVRFRVERELARGDVSTAEGKDAVLAALRPVFAGLPPSVLREDLLRTIADRLDVEPSLAASLLGRGASARPAAPAARPGYSAPGAPRAAADAPAAPRTQGIERTFLELCVAHPSGGREALARIDVDEHFASPLMRRAAEHLREHLDAPTEGIPDDDPELASLMMALTVDAARHGASTATLDAQRLQLELQRIDRRIRAARAAGEPVADWAKRKKELKDQFDEAIERSVNSG